MFTSAASPIARFARGLAALGCLTTAVFAADTSEPVGTFRLRLRGSSDTIVSLPLQRPALVATSIASRLNSTLTLAADVPTLPTEGAFALIMSGALEGAALPITSVSGRTLTVDAAGFDLATVKTVAVNGTTTADLIDVVPYWTLDTLFPAGASVHASTSATTRNSELLLFDGAKAGVNLSATATYFYFPGSASKAAGWYLVGDTAAPKGGTRLLPHTWFIVRHNLATDTVLSILGGVQMAGFRVAVRLRQANTDEDNLVALPIATPVTLGDSRLVESGAFLASPSASNRTDELLVFDNSIVGQNKSAAATFFYFAGSATKAAGWYKVGDTAQTSNSFQLKPGEGYVIRKRQAAAARTDQWNGLPGYLR